MFGRTLTCLFLAALLPIAGSPQPAPATDRHEKTVWNYDGGIVLATDGEIPEGPCFRIMGHLTADNFFDNLRREDTNSGTLYRRGNDIVTEFPPMLHLSLMLHDQQCDRSLKQTKTPVYLTKSMITSMRIRFSWKHGMELRPAREIKITHAEAQLIPPYAIQLANELPERYEWFFDFDVATKSIPLTDSLVIVFLTPDNHIIARVAARL